jgi:hypothetical protein
MQAKHKEDGVDGKYSFFVRGYVPFLTELIVIKK